MPYRCGVETTPDRVARALACPLWPGALNRWVLRRSLAGNPDDAEILSSLRAALASWFDARHAWGAAHVLGNVRALVRRKTLDLDDVAASSDDVSPLPVLLGDRWASVRFDWLYLGVAESMPWPVLDASGAWSACDCVWSLDLVGN